MVFKSSIVQLPEGFTCPWGTVRRRWMEDLQAEQGAKGTAESQRQNVDGAVVSE